MCDHDDYVMEFPNRQSLDFRMRCRRCGDTLPANQYPSAGTFDRTRGLSIVLALATLPLLALVVSIVTAVR